MSKRFFLLFLGLVAAAYAGETIRLPATPALTPDGRQLVFEWREDLWIAPSTGGVAQALTRHPAVDRFPVISPDGTQVAFMSGRDDTFQTYVMPLTGGVPRQVTFHSDGAVPQDWYPDGRHLLVRGARDSGMFQPHRLIRVDVAERHAEEAVFDDYGEWGHVAPDGRSILFQRDGEDIYRRGYRGSKAATIWRFTPESGKFDPLCADTGGRECRWPLWRPDGKSFYFTQEDAAGVMNLWEKEIGKDNPRQRTFLKDYGVVIPTISRDGSTVIFRSGFDFFIWHPASQEPPAIVGLSAAGDAGDREVRRVTYNRANNHDVPGSVDFADDGKQVLFAAGGNLFAMDTVLCDPVAITTGTLGIDNWASFTPGASNVFFLRDTGSRVNIWKASRRNPAEPWWKNTAFDLQPVTDDQRGRSNFSIDPSGQRLAWSERPGSLWVSGLDGAHPRCLMRSPGDIFYDWSPDGRWMACMAQDSDDNWDIWIVSVEGEREPFNVSRHPNWDGDPVWSPDGRCLAYIGRTYDNDVDIYYVWLRLEDYGRLERDTKMAEVAPKSGQKVAEAAAATNGLPKVAIDFAGLQDRVQRITLKGNSPRNLFWSWDSKALAFQGSCDGKEGTWKLYFPHPGKPDLLTTTRGDWARWTSKGLFWAVDEVPATLDNRHNFSVQVERDERAWRRIAFGRMWRAMRDEFYDPALNNLDWNALLARYEAVLNDLDESAFVRAANMMFGELNASHLDYRLPERNPQFAGAWKWQTGHLGVRFDQARTGTGLRVSQVLPDVPAGRPSTEIRTGDVVVAVNGMAVGPGVDLTLELNGPLPREVDVELQRDGSNRTIRLPLINSDTARERAAKALVEQSTARVHEWSKGRLGYLLISGMKTENLRQFEKEIYAQGYGHDGLVVDVRNNTGGFTADQILAILCQPRHAVTIPRGGGLSYQGGYLGRPYWFKPVIVLCNAYTASNGEIFSHAIKNLGRGKLVGQPTQGGVISTADREVLDLGTYRIPLRGWFLQPSGLDMELHGAQPDILVDDPPGARARGADPQLEKAVSVLMADLPDANASQTAVHYSSGDRTRGK